MPGPVTFVIGGCRSGKSREAQRLAEAAASRRIYVATCVPMDAEMEDRVRRHRADRDATWSTIETPLEVARAVRERSGPETVLVVDCLTLWVTNLLLSPDPPDAPGAAVGELVAALDDAAGPVVLVGNEVGLGIVPDNGLARRFRDWAGWVNQAVAARADRVVWMVAGIPVTVKPEGGRP